MIEDKEVISIGTMRRPHGKQGEIQCQMDNMYWDEAEADFIILRMDGILVPFRVKDWRGKGEDTIIFRIKGIDTEEKAAQLNGAVAYMLRRDIAEDGENEMTWQDLKGYEVLDETQKTVGIVSQVDESTINTLLEMENGRLIPIHEDFILSIDEDKHIIVLQIPEGL